MAREYLTPTGVMVNETGARQFLGPYGAAYNEEGATGSAAVNADLVISYNVAAATGSAVSADLVLDYNVRAQVNANLVLSYNVLVASGTVSTEQLENNAGTAYTTETVHYSWFPGGRTGALAGITPTEGSKSLVAGVLTLTGLPTGPGMLKGAVRGASAALDAEFLQHLTAS